MAFWNRKGESLTAAGRVDSDKGGVVKKARPPEDWQSDAWDFYRQIPELWFGFNFIANALRRVRIYPATQPDPMKPPIPLKPEDEKYDAAMAELNRLRSSDGTHGELIHDFSIQLSIPGEGYLVLMTPEDAAKCMVEEVGVYSVTEITRNTDDSKGVKYFYHGGPNDSQGVELSAKTFCARIWRQHPQWSQLADSAMSADQESCRELLILERYFRSCGKSQTNAGLLLWPQEADVRSTPRLSGDAGGGAFSKDKLLNDIMVALLTPTLDEGTASTVVPGLIKMKADMIEKVRHLTLSRMYDAEATKRADVLLHRIVGGLDIPSEVVFGLGELTHWNAWQVSEDTFDQHFAPMLNLICAGLTSAYLRPHLSSEATDGGTGYTEDEVLVWYDPSALISHPHKASDADKALRLGAISYPAYLRYKGYTDDDAATEEDHKTLERINPRGTTIPTSITNSRADNVVGAD